MLQVYLGGTLLVVGMLALLGNPVIGGVLVAIGAGMFLTSSKDHRSDALAVFGGIAIVCGAVLTAVTLLDVLF